MLSSQLHSTPDVQTVWILFSKHCRTYSVNKSLANISKRLVMAGSDVKVKSFDSVVPSPDEAWRNQNDGPMRNLSADENMMKYSFVGIRKRCNCSINLHLASELDFFYIYFSAHAVQFSHYQCIQTKTRKKFPHYSQPDKKARCSFLYAYVTLFFPNYKPGEGCRADRHMGNAIYW